MGGLSKRPSQDSSAKAILSKSREATHRASAPSWPDFH